MSDIFYKPLTSQLRTDINDSINKTLAEKKRNERNGN